MNNERCVHHLECTGNIEQRLRTMTRGSHSVVRGKHQRGTDALTSDERSIHRGEQIAVADASFHVVADAPQPAFYPCAVICAQKNLHQITPIPCVISS